MLVAVMITLPALIHIIACHSIAKEACFTAAFEEANSVLASSMLITVVKVVGALINVVTAHAVNLETRSTSTCKAADRVATVCMGMASVGEVSTFIIILASMVDKVKTIFARVTQ